MEQKLLNGGIVTMDPRLDRVPHFDERSRDYPIRALIDTRRERSYTWSVYAHLNQFQEGACTGFNVAHELAARPVVIPGLDNEFARRIYFRARQLDPWPGEAYEGSSVLAAVQAAQELGYYGEYRWAFGESDLALAVGYKGPVLLGIPWYEGMMEPDSNGYIHPTGQLVGYHAILCHAISLPGDNYWVWQSWGQPWGIGGRAKIKRSDMRNVLLPNQGEACIPVRRLKPRA